MSQAKACSIPFRSLDDTHMVFWVYIELYDLTSGLWYTYRGLFIENQFSALVLTLKTTCCLQGLAPGCLPSLYSKQEAIGDYLPQFVGNRPLDRPSGCLGYWQAHWSRSGSEPIQCVNHISSGDMIGVKRGQIRPWHFYGVGVAKAVREALLPKDNFSNLLQQSQLC